MLNDEEIVESVLIRATDRIARHWGVAPSKVEIRYQRQEGGGGVWRITVLKRHAAVSADGVGKLDAAIAKINAMKNASTTRTT